MDQITGLRSFELTCASLVALRQPRIASSSQLGTPVTFITISPNPKVMVSRIMMNPSTNKYRLKKVPYKLLPPSEQYDYCRKIVINVYLKWLSDPCEVIGTWELNKEGLVHFHLLICSDEIKTEYDMKLLRQSVSCHEEVIKNMSKGKNARDYMNNIVYVTKPIDEVIKYLDKDYEQKVRYFSTMPQFYISDD